MPISVMLKPASSNCNLACEYCFYHSLSAQREDFSKGFMSDETAKRVIDSALEFANSTDVYFTFQGGEPLLCSVEFYKSFVSYVKKANINGSNVHYCLQTNGTLINDEFARFFKENEFLIGISLDGDEDINKYRVYPSGENSFSDIMRGIEILKEHNVMFNVLSVLTKNTALNFRKAYRFFKSNDLRYIQFIIGLKPFDAEIENDMYMNNDDYLYFLTKCFNIYFNDRLRGDIISVRTFDNYISLINGNNAEQCGMNGVCSEQFVVEGDGSVYPCDFYCTDEWYIDNINNTSFKEIRNNQKYVEFIKNSFKLDYKCKKCDYFYICRGGGCKRNRESCDYCDAYKRFFSEYEYKLKQLKK